MTFTELRFIWFLLIVFGLHWSIPSHRWRKVMLLASSYLFYGAWDERFLLLIALSTVVDYCVGIGLSRTEKRTKRNALLAASLTVNLGLLGVFKYFNFFTESGAAFLGWLGFNVSPYTVNLILPVGISFYTFKTLSYTIDVWRQKAEPTRDFFDYALFVSFFPQLLAGPITRARDFLFQLDESRHFDEVPFRAALTLFLFGFIKKACIADNVAVVVDAIFAAPGEYSAAGLWLGAVLYFIQIYADFSGYSDMAIATAALFGYKLPLNFFFPIWARSITDFWRRWHISLSSWFRDYLYIPLGGNRKGNFNTYRNLWLVFFLCGLWHGPAWTFVLWGTIHGLVLVIERIFRLHKLLQATPLGWLWAFPIATFAWVFFRMPEIGEAFTYIQGMLGLGEGTQIAADWIRWVGVCALFYAFHGINLLARIDQKLEKLPRLVFAVFIGAAFALALPFVATTYKPFIYFQF